MGLAAPAFGQSSAHRGHAIDKGAPAHPHIMAGYGVGGFPIHTSSAEAQAFFSNGMELATAFEHGAAKAAFAEAVRLDPQCVMCAWGEAWSNGPTINYGIEGDDLGRAQKLAAHANALALDHGTPLERQLTAAIVARYTGGGGGGKKGDRAFLGRMAKVARSNPSDDALQTLAADAALNTIAENDGDSVIARKARKAMTFLTPVLARSPNFTPAIHFYIHASEAAQVPAYAEPYADRLMALAPLSQHLVHMPSHTYYWVGRYRDAGLVNLRAIQIGMANAAKISPPPKEGAFAQRYHSHNVNFGLGGALIAGDPDTALAIARPLLAAANATDSKVSKGLAGFGLIALAEFAPDELMAMQQPSNAMMSDYWHYARGEVFAARGDAASVRVEEKAMRPSPELPAGTPPQAVAMYRTTYQIAHQVLLGREAMVERDYPRAIAAFQKAATLEEGKDYSRQMDPPAWWYPVRRSLAEARLASGDVAGARADAKATLDRRPREPGTLSLMAKLDGRVAAR